MDRIRQFGQWVQAGDAYRQLAEFVDYEAGMSSVELGLGIGVDGTIRRFEILRVEAGENRHRDKSGGAGVLGSLSQRVASSEAVDSEQSHVHRSGPRYGPTHGGGDIVQLQVEEAFRACGMHCFDSRRPNRGVELEPHLEGPDVLARLVDQRFGRV